MPSDENEDRSEPDPVDEAAATIDARAPDAPERIEALKDFAEALDRNDDGASTTG